MVYILFDRCSWPKKGIITNMFYIFSYFYYSVSAISYTEYIMEYNIMAQSRGLTMSL